MFKTAARRIGVGLAIAALVFVVVTIVTARWGDPSLWPPAPGAPITEAFIVSHGYHAGIIVPRAALAEQASRRGLSALGYLATRFADFDRLEIGWGDEGFYRDVRPQQGQLHAAGTRARPLWDQSVLSRQRRVSSLQRLQSLDRQLARCRR